MKASNEWNKARAAYERVLCEAIKREVRGARAFNRYAIEQTRLGNYHTAMTYKHARDSFKARARKRWVEYYRSLNGTT